MKASPLRDQRIGRLLAARKCRALKQAAEGGTSLQNIKRIAEWRNRYALVPIEQTLPPRSGASVTAFDPVAPLRFLLTWERK